MENKILNLKRSTPGLLTLICLGSLVPLFLTVIFGPKSGLESLILIVPLMATLSTHILLGPIALFLSWRDPNRFLVIIIWLYFCIFASISLGYWAWFNDVPRHASSYWRDIVHPEDAELSKLIRDRDTAVKETLEAVESGADVDHITPDKRTPLMEAVMVNRPEVVKVLLESGADPNQSGANGETPLYMAAVNLQPEITRILLEGGADPNLDSGKNSPLCRVLRTVAMPKLPPLQDQLVKLLINAGADGSGACGYKSYINSYQVAIGYGMHSVVSLLVNAGHQITKDPLHVDYGTALYGAVHQGQEEWLQTLLKAGISPDAQNHNSRTPLEVAIGGGKLEFVQSLLNAGADPRLRTYVYQITRLSTDRTDLLQILLSAGAAVDDGIGGNGGALYQAAKKNRLDQVQLLMQAGADPDALNQQGLPILISLQRRPLTDQKRQLIMTLLEERANPKVRDNQGRTALMVSVQRGDVELSEALFRAGASVNARDPKGRTAAHLAADLYDAEAIISWLAEAGADFSLLNREGLSPLCVAVHNRRKHAMRAILAINSVSMNCGINSVTALWRAVTERDIETLRLLLEMGINPNDQDQQGRNALEEAARRGFMDGFDLLLSVGANPNALVVSGYALKSNANFGHTPWRYPPKRSTPRIPLPLVTAALLGGYDEALASLLKAGANPRPQDSDGNTPLLALASAKPGTVNVYKGVQRLIKTAGTEQSIDSEGYTAATRAATNDRLHLLSAFAKGGLDLNTADGKGRQVIDILVQNSYQAQRLKELINLGLKVTPKARSLALERGKRNIIRVLR